MATTQTLEKRSVFDSLIRGWDSRIRLRQRLIWLPRAVLLGLVVGLIGAYLSRISPRLSDGTIIAITGIAIAACVAIMLFLIQVRARTPLQSARELDMEFGLQERLSTALELLEGRIKGHPEINDYQIQDAWHTAREIDPKAGVELQVRVRDWVVVAVAALGLALVILLPDAADNLTPAQAAVIEEASDTVRDITESVAANTTLEEERRESLLQTLENSLDTLEDENTSPEEAFAVMRDVEEALRNQAQQLGERVRIQQEALNATAEALREFGQPSNEEGEEIPTLSELLEQARAQMENLTSEQRAALANALDQAAEANLDINPELAEALEQAAENVQQGNQQLSQEALEQALEDLQNLEESQLDQNQMIQQLEQNAEAAEEASNQIARPSEQQGEQPDPNSQNIQQGENPNQPLPANASLPSSEQQPPTGGEQPNDQQEGNSSSVGAGDSDDTGTTATFNSSEEGEIDQDNTPDGTGVAEYEVIYSPQRIGEEGQSPGESIELESDPGDMPVVEGDFSENPAGAAIVPYNQVFTTYQNAANRAIDVGFVPPSRRDIVRNYFTSLEPDDGP
jgi:hypothetical protein